MVDATLSPSARPFFPGSESKHQQNSALSKEGEAPQATGAEEKEERLPDELDYKILTMKAQHQYI